jgi:methyl-accepting chemotaxis protein
MLLAMGVSTGATYFLSVKSLNEDAADRLAMIAKSRVEVLDVWLEDMKIFVSASTERPAYVAVLKEKTEDTVNRANAALSGLVKLCPAMYLINVANSEGVVVASSSPEYIGNLKVPEREYFQKALKGELNISDVYVGKTTGKPAFCVAAPLQDDGKAVGVLYAVVDVGRFSAKFIDPVKVMQSGYVAISDSSGVVLAHKDSSLVMKLHLNETDFGREMLKRRHGEMIYESQHEKQAAFLESSSVVDWILIASAPYAEVVGSAKRMAKINVAFLLAGSLLSAAILYFIGRSISRPIMRAVIGLRTGVDQVAAASGQLSSSSHELADGASEQAASIEQTSSSLEEMASMTKQNAENSNQANRLIEETRDTVSQAGLIKDELTSSMGEISRASEQTSKIVKTIDEIAFQTNLLALNAAVEAARAGEAGAGFAVVADEVRNLAMRAAEAAKNTASLIEGTVERVKEGSELVERTNNEFRKVAASVSRSSELIGEISAASQEQAQGIEQVNTAVSAMDKVVQRNAANAEESASVSEEMSAQAENLKEFVAGLVALV